MAKEFIKVLALQHIARDEHLQMRAKVDHDYIDQLAEVIASGKDFDGQLPVVFQAGGQNWLADGYQRYAAHEKAEVKKMKCLVRVGSFRDAQAYALSANARHGARRTNDDKRKAVETALADDEWCQFSDHAIAELCGVSDRFVASLRKNSPTNGSQSQPNTQTTSTTNRSQSSNTRIGRDGRAINTENIGKKANSESTEAPKTDDTKTPENANSDTSENVEDAEITEVKPAASVKPPTQVDEWGIPIQEHAAEAFAEVPRFNELLAMIRKAQKLFNELANAPGGKLLTKPAISSYRRGKKDESGQHEDRFVLPDLENALRKVSECVPTHTVCPWQYVKGKHPDPCSACGGLNWTGPLSETTEQAAKSKVQAAFGVNTEAAA